MQMVRDNDGHVLATEDWGTTLASLFRWTKLLLGKTYDEKCSEK